MLDELKVEINKLKSKAKDLGNILKVQDKKKRLGEVEKEVADPAARSQASSGKESAGKGALLLGRIT
jgi:hypothetical protein